MNQLYYIEMDIHKKTIHLYLTVLHTHTLKILSVVLTIIKTSNKSNPMAEPTAS